MNWLCQFCFHLPHKRHRSPEQLDEVARLIKILNRRSSVIGRMLTSCIDQREHKTLSHR